jgi:hypothetical protein
MNTIATGEIMVRPRLGTILIALIFFTFSAGEVGAQTQSTVAGWVISFLPKGVTVKTSTCAELPTAVVAAMRAHPQHAKAIIRYVFSQFIPTDNCKALGVLDAMISSFPKGEIAGLIAVGIGSLSATVNPDTGQSALLALSSLLTERAIADDPALGSALLAAIGAAAPGQQGLLQSSGPGGVTNPANFSNTSGSVNSPQ